MPPERPNVAIFTPSLLVTVTVEAGDEATSQIHFHVGGQGFWIARMVRELGERPVLVAPVGGEPGQVLRGLIRSSGIDFSPVAVAGDSSAYVHDRRGGERTEVAASRAPDLDRHEIDDLYARVLQHSIQAGVCVVTGLRPEDRLPVEFYTRLSKDCAAAEVRTVGDLHGSELHAFLDGGSLDLLKVSDEDLIEDGLLEGTGESQGLSAIHALVERGARNVVLSRSEKPVLAFISGTTYRATQPALEPADYRGAGDSMTAGLAAAFSRGLGPEETLRLACGAGAANATRHGLGSASNDLIAKLAERVEIETLSSAPG